MVILRKNHLGRESLCLFGSHLAVCHNDNLVTYLSLACRCTIKTDTATATLTGYGVGIKTLAVIIINNEHALTGKETDSIHEVLIYSNTAHVVQIGLCDADAVYLTF